VAQRKRRYPKEEFARRGDEIYQCVVWPTLTRTDEHKFVAIDIETAAFEVDEDELTASDRLYARIPNAQPWLTKVGSFSEHKLAAVPAVRMLSPRIIRRS
jgi:hypothetical protein